MLLISPSSVSHFWLRSSLHHMRLVHDQGIKILHQLMRLVKVDMLECFGL